MADPDPQTPGFVPLEDLAVRRSGRTTFQRVMKAATESVSSLIGGSADAPLPGGYRSAEAERLADFIVSHTLPQSEIEALAIAGTAGAGGLAAKLTTQGLPAALTRIGGGILGGETGGQISGEPTGKGALIGGVGAFAGEVVGAGVNLARSIGAKRVAAKIQTKDAAALGSVLENAGPTTLPIPSGPPPTPLFPGVRTPEQLAQLALREDVGLATLRAQQDAADTFISQKIGTRLTRLPSDPKTWVPYQAAVQELREGGASAFPKSQQTPLTATPRAAKVEQREAVERMMEDLWAADPSGEAVTMFQLARNQYRQGRGWLDLLGQAFKPGRLEANRVVFATDELMGMLSTKEGDRIRRKIGDRAYTGVEAVVFRGEGPFRRDVLQAGTKFGFFPQIPGVPGAFIPFRMGEAQFVGRPTEMGALGRTLLDVGGIDLTREAAEIGLPPGPLRIPGTSPTPQ